MFYSHQLLLTTTNVVAGMLILSGLGALPLVGGAWYCFTILIKIMKSIHNSVKNFQSKH